MLQRLHTFVNGQADPQFADKIDAEFQQIVDEENRKENLILDANNHRDGIVPVTLLAENSVDCSAATSITLQLPNGASDLVIFEDDPTNAIDFNKWTTPYGGASTDGSCIVLGSTTSAYRYLDSITLFNYPVGNLTLVLEFRASIPHTQYGYVGFGFGDIYIGHRWDDTSYTHVTTTGLGGTTYSLGANYRNTFMTYKIVITATQAHFYVDGVFKTVLNHSLTGNTIIHGNAYDANTYLKLDWVKLYYTTSIDWLFK